MKYIDHGDGIRRRTPESHEHRWRVRQSRLTRIAVLLACAITHVRCDGPIVLKHPEWRGLLASPGFEGTAVKGVYFFPGDRRKEPDGKYIENYTTHPLDPRDEQWNTTPSTRGWVMDRLVGAHASTLVLSYWSDMPQWSPMDVQSTTPRAVVCVRHPERKYFVERADTVPGVLDAIAGRHLVVMPAVEQGSDAECPEIPHWEFADEFPYAPSKPRQDARCVALRAQVTKSEKAVAELKTADTHGIPTQHPSAALAEAQRQLASDRLALWDCERNVAPGLVSRIGKLVELFRGRMHLWAQMYDRNGDPRYAVHILHVDSNVIDQRPEDPRDDQQFANGFTELAVRVKQLYQIDVGFTIDTTVRGTRYSAFPHEAGAALERTPSVLAIQGFASEVFSGLIKDGSDGPCVLTARGYCEPFDNNRENLERLADWKRGALGAWLDTSIPVILDVLNGYDARFVFGKVNDKPVHTGFWGDNLDGTDDRWRNWMSELKGARVKGIVFDTWNGYTEGYAAVPSREHGQTVIHWLTDLLEPPPWNCSHMHYVNGAGTQRVYGKICEKWIQLGADRAFGAPVSEELPNGGGRVQYFTDGKAIYWSGITGARATIGLIGKAYRQAGGGASCLGFPVTDEESSGADRISRFERGTVTLTPGDASARIQCGP